VSDFPEITTEQIVARLRMIVAEPDSLCKTDIHYIEDAADELESKGDEIARLTAERDEARRQRDEARREVCKRVESASCLSDGEPTTLASDYARWCGWDCFKEDGK
jgi:hypothetical protein